MALNPTSNFMLVRICRGHPRLIVSILLAVAGYAALTAATQLPLSTRAIAAWDIGVLVYLAAVYTMMARSGPYDIAGHANAQDEGAFAIFILTLLAALAFERRDLRA